jgi:hypothetical protein
LEQDQRTRREPADYDGGRTRPPSVDHGARLARAVARRSGVQIREAAPISLDLRLMRAS